MANLFLERLYAAVMKQPHRRKIVLAPSFAEGQAWLARMSRELGPILNAEVQAIRALAAGHAEFPLFKQGITLLSEQRVRRLVHHLMEREASDGSYIQAAQIKPGVVSYVFQAIMDLRHAGIRAEELGEEHFLSGAKGSYMRKLLSAYEQTLERGKWTDYPGLLPFLELIPSIEATFIMPDPMPLGAVESAMLERLSGGAIMRMPLGPPFYAKESGVPDRVDDLFHATGKLAETREVLRRLTAAHIPLDEVELIVTGESYATIIAGLCASMGIGCSFAQGLPLETTKMGRAAYALLQWLESDFQTEQLESLLRQELLSLADPEREISNADCIRILEGSGIGWSAMRYDKLLTMDDDAANYLHRILAVYMQTGPSGAWTPGSLLRWLVELLDRHGVSHTEEDRSVLEAIRELGKELEEGLPSGMGADVSLMSLELALIYVRDLLGGIRAGVKPTPEAGALFVSGLGSGGTSGRRHTFVLGMDEHAWSGMPRQNPMLLDDEKRAISSKLAGAAEAKREQRLLRDARLGMLGGNATFSYSAYEAADGAAASPAYELLRLYRSVSGNANADYGALVNALGEPIGYAGADRWPRALLHPAAPGTALDYSARLLQMIEGRGSRFPMLATVEEIFPGLRAGRIAAQSRADLPVSAYDGYLNSAQWSDRWRSAMKERALSASQLERYAECPMRYMFSHLLGMRPKETVRFDRFAWLRPNEKGTLLHEVYRRYMSEVFGERRAKAAHDPALLRRIADETIAAFAEQIPAPSPHVFDREREAIYRDIDVFYRMKPELGALPLYYEQELNVDGEPIQLELERGALIQLRGIVDRIDELAPHRYRIIDYKTGSPAPYKESGRFAGGTQLQHALYAMGTEQWLRSSGIDAEAVVLEAAYVFPGERGRGAVVTRQQTERQTAMRTVQGLLSSMEQGLFVPTSDPAVCRYCDYAAVCGNHAELMAVKRSDEDNASVLNTLLEVESID